MLHMESPPHHIYSPLSQEVMTDSESEEEIHSSSKHREHLQRLHEEQQQLKLQNQQRRNPPNTLALNRNLQQLYDNKTQSTIVNGNKPNSKQPSSYTTNMQNTFRSVMMSDIGGINGDAANYAPGSNFSNFNSDYDECNNDSDNIAILGNRSKNPASNEPMSPMRRCCFIASLLLCVFAIFSFIWLVPCGEEGICPAPTDRIKTHNWLNNYTKIELKGGVNVVSGLRNWENNLIFLYRGDAFFPEFKEQRNAKRNGIISLIGSSGAVAWYDEMVDEPVAIDCTLVDVDQNGRPDCLVIDEYGELGTINPISGQWHWRFKERSAHKVDAFDFPVILPDLDGDGVLEILIVTGAGLEERTKSLVRKGEVKQTGHVIDERNFIRILSGRTGHTIGERFKLHDCDVVRNLQLESEQTVTYNCQRNNTEAQRTKTLSELFALITNKSIVGQKLVPASKIAQHRHYGQRKDIDAQRNIYSLSGRELIVENRGKCPENCNVTFRLSEMRNGTMTILRNFTNASMYGHVPAQWHFKNSKTKKSLSGFVMKFWKWNTLRNTQNLIPTINGNDTFQKAYNAKKAKANTIKDNTTKTTGKQNQTQYNKTRKHQPRKRELQWEQFPINEFDVFDHRIQKRHTHSIPERGGNMTKQKQLSNILFNNYKMQIITETVILVIFVGADTRIENTSQSNIVQFCRNERNELVCQPDLNNQENSMLIADLDLDGSQELVSYMSTFIQPSENPQDWKLVTYVRLLRLQSELPAFYEDEKRSK